MVLALLGTLASDRLTAQPSVATAGPAARGWTFTYTVALSAAGRSSENGGLTLDVAVWRGTARITVRDGALRSLTGDRGTILVRSRDSTIAVLDPTRRDALVARANDVGALLTGGQAGALPIDVSEVSSVTQRRGAGPRTLGFTTRHVEIEQRYTMHLSSPTVKRTLRTEQTVELDVSRDVAKLDAGFQAFMELFAHALDSPAAVRASLRAVERGVPSGVPLRRSTTALTIVGADTLRTTRRAEVTAINRATVDTTTFVVPAGFRVTEMGRLLQRRTAP
jgi:hypothetical protein